MSLTTSDLLQIRTLLREEVGQIVREEVRPIIREEVRPVIREEVNAILDTRLQTIEAKLDTLENDVKELYFMVADIQKAIAPAQAFGKLTVEQKLLKINKELLLAAKQAGVILPR